MSAASFSLYQLDRELRRDELIDELAMPERVGHELAHEESHAARLRDALG